VDPIPTGTYEYEALTREIARLEVDRASVHDQILAAGRGPRASRSRIGQSRAEAVEVVRETVRVLREASEPLPRREVAARLGIKPWAASYRLDKAVELRFVEKLGGGRYQVTNVVPAF
jgi:hypothetical protein